MIIEIMLFLFHTSYVDPLCKSTKFKIGFPQIKSSSSGGSKRSNASPPQTFRKPEITGVKKEDECMSK